MLTDVAHPQLTGRIALDATDLQTCWSLDLDTGSGIRTSISGPLSTPVALSGTGSELLLWLTNRLPAWRLGPIADQPAVAAWTHLCR